MGRRGWFVTLPSPRWALTLGVVFVLVGLFGAYVDVLGWWRVAHPLPGFRSIAPLATVLFVSVVVFEASGGAMLGQWYRSRQQRSY